MVRSFLFVAAFYLTTAAFLLLGSPLLLGPRSWAMAGLAAHARAICWLMRAIVGTRIEVRGRRNLPEGAALVAAKHQSPWDTIGLVPMLHDPAFVLKAELLAIPVYGAFCRKFEMIAIARDKRGAALRQLLKDAQSRAADNRHILIFPEGTRQPVGAPPDYKPGIVALYEALDLPCVPLALNSGLFWPRKGMGYRPGTIVVEFLPPIMPGLERKAFMVELRDRIETATTSLVAEARVATGQNSTK